MKKNTYILFACILFLLGWGLYYFFRAEAPKTLPSVQPQAEESAKMLYSGNTLVQEKNGKKIWELTAEKIEVDTQSKNVQLKSVKGIFYQDNGGKLELTAPLAAMDNETKDVILQGRVEAIGEEGTSFSAQEIKWLDKEQKIYGTGNIILKKADTVITGDHIESDANIEKVKIQGNAHIQKGEQ